MNTLKQIIDLSELALADLNKYPKKRYLYQKLAPKKSKHFTGIVGPRGVGKTILLKHLASKDKGACYISLDSFDDCDLFDVIRELNENYKITSFFIDEIHFNENYSKSLKKIYDFLNVKLTFTSSVALSIIDSSYDLSRRVNLHYLYPFSFREYLFFKFDKKVPCISLRDIFSNKISSELLKLDSHFDKYLSGGLMPFTLDEPDFMPLMSNILNKIIQKDIPSFASIKVEEINKIKKVVKFIGKSEVDGLNFSSVAKNIGITKYKAESYINLLNKSFILNPVFPVGTNVLHEPKILMFLPYRLLYKDFVNSIGGLREDFFCETMLAANIPFNYLKTKRGAKTPDYYIQYNDEKIVVEVGGKSKGREQFKGITDKKKFIFSHSSIIDKLRRPLFLLGLLN